MGNDPIILPDPGSDKANSQEPQPYPLIVYQPEGTALEIRLSADPDRRTIWATQRQIAEALDLDVRTVSGHIQNYKKQRGDRANQGIRNFRIPTNGGMQDVEHYDMTIVTYIGFRAQATERVIEFQDWVGKELDQLLTQRKPTQTRAEHLLEQAQAMVEQERSLRNLTYRQEHVEYRLTNVEDRLSRVEARQTTMIDSSSLHMTLIAYCMWKNFDGSTLNLRHLPALTDKARQLSKDKRYPIGKAPNPRGNYDDTFHIDVLNEIFAAYL